MCHQFLSLWMQVVLLVVPIWNHVAQQLLLVDEWGDNKVHDDDNSLTFVCCTNNKKMNIKSAHQFYNDDDDNNITTAATTTTTMFPIKCYSACYFFWNTCHHLLSLWTNLELCGTTFIIGG